MTFGIGQGMLDGGQDIDIPIESVPPELRSSNSEFWLRFDEDGNPHIKPIE